MPCIYSKHFLAPVLEDGTINQFLLLYVESRESSRLAVNTYIEACRVRSTNSECGLVASLDPPSAFYVQYKVNSFIVRAAGRRCCILLSLVAVPALKAVDLEVIG